MDSSILQCDNVAYYILHKMNLYQDQIAQIEFETGRMLTFCEIRLKVKQFATYLIECGIGGGDVVCLCVMNSTDFSWLLLGSLLAGATCALISPSIKPRELEHILGLTRPKMIFASTLTPEQQLVVNKFVNIKKCIYICDIILNESMDKEIHANCVDGDSTALILTSSGSTGMPKGVMLSHNNITTVMKASGKFVSGDDKFFGLMPFHHAFGLILMLYGLCEGSQVITMAKLKWEAFVNALSDYQVTVLFLVPSLLVSLGKHEGVTAERMKSVRRIFSGASQINPKYQEIMSNCFPHIELYHSYGMTETCFVTYCGKYRPDKPGSCGLLVDTIKCKVIDANGDEVKANEMGEFCFKGPTVMKGYLNNDEATRESIDENGWLHSGDIGYFDEDGYYFVKERIKEIIKYQGHQISPSEIESVLMLHKGVTDAAVVGVPDPHYGELPRAYVVKTDSNITEEELVKFINVELSPHKQLRGGVRFVDSLPKTVSGKILRRELRSFSR